MTQQATMMPTPVFQSTVQDIRAGPSYCIWENLQHNGNEMEQNEGQLENDSDRSRERRHKKSRVSKHAYRKHKTKQKSSWSVWICNPVFKHCTLFCKAYESLKIIFLFLMSSWNNKIIRVPACKGIYPVTYQCASVSNGWKGYHLLFIFLYREC